MTLHFGLQKFLDFGSTVEGLRSDGWRAPTFAGLLNAGAETVGGAALLLGVLTPLAAAAILGAMLDAWAVNVAHTAFWADPFNLPFVLAFGALGLLFTGAGAYSVDARLWHRERWPAPIVAAALVIAVVAGILTWLVLNGNNPIHLTIPKG
jgi:uncharacterized membrane protein YphA (DoxX/SURF4 family)